MIENLLLMYFISALLVMIGLRINGDRPDSWCKVCWFIVFCPILNNAIGAASIIFIIFEIDWSFITKERTIKRAIKEPKHDKS